MARFEREAQVLTGLNHPNIAAIYGVENRALVLELVEGPTLDDCIAQGAMPMDEALPLIRQLIDAIDHAHQKGIIHRDLKPANIKVTPDGRLKVLDFGLAKALSGMSQSANPEPANSATLTLAAGSGMGVILGTAAYMAPEQARGKIIDKRADIWPSASWFSNCSPGAGCSRANRSATLWLRRSLGRSIWMRSPQAQGPSSAAVSSVIPRSASAISATRSTSSSL